MSLAVGVFIILSVRVAAQPTRTFKIGVLSGVGAQRALGGFQEALSQLGYTEGRHVIYEKRSAGPNNTQFPSLAAELVGAHVDIIVAVSTPAALAAKTATTTIPVVFFAVADPVGTGLVTSLARPGGNVTGVSQATAEGLPGKRLELLKEAAPTVSRLAVLWVTTNPGNQVTALMLERATQALHMKIQSVGVRAPDDFTAAFRVIREQRADSLTVFPDILTFGELQRIVDFAAQNRLPAVYAYREFVEAGGFISYGIDSAAAGRAAAAFVVKILNGARASDLPVEQATKHELIINLRAAKALGLTIPQSLLLRADQVIE